MATKRNGRSKDKSKSQSIYKLKITLLGSKPPIWRRLLVPGKATLYKLHKIIQVAMGWTNSHLHQFEVDDMVFSDPSFELEYAENESRAKLRDVAPRVKSRILYTYDLGDDWTHEIRVEDIILPKESVPAHRRTVAASGDIPDS